jgi:hypothetical protein
MPTSPYKGAMIRTCGWFSAGWGDEAHLPEDDLKSM